MKITSVELHPAGSTAVCVLSFRDPAAKNPFNVRAITGLDAEDIVPRYYGGGVSKFYSLWLQSRNISARIQLNPNSGLDETYSSLRDELYKLISSSRTGLVQIQFKNGNTVVATVSGFVTKFESALFEKSPEVALTFRCDDPLLRAPNDVAVPVGGLSPANTVIDDELSTAPHGVKFQVTFTAAVPTFTLTDPNDPSWSFAMTPTLYGGFMNGDILNLSSEYNERAVAVTRGAATYNLADTILPGSVWPIIFPGVNHLAIASPGSLHWTSIAYRPTYWGV